FGAYDRPGVQEQVGQDRPVPGGHRGQTTARGAHLNGAQDAEPHAHRRPLATGALGGINLDRYATESIITGSESTNAAHPIAAAPGCAPSWRGLALGLGEPGAAGGGSRPECASGCPSRMHSGCINAAAHACSLTGTRPAVNKESNHATTYDQSGDGPSGRDAGHPAPVQG